MTEPLSTHPDDKPVWEVGPCYYGGYMVGNDGVVKAGHDTLSAAPPDSIGGKDIIARIRALQEDLSVARQSLYEVAEQRNSLEERVRELERLDEKDGTLEIIQANARLEKSVRALEVERDKWKKRAQRNQSCYRFVQDLADATEGGPEDSPLSLAEDHVASQDKELEEMAMRATALEAERDELRDELKWAYAKLYSAHKDLQDADLPVSNVKYFRKLEKP